jgi:GntR family transcriptional regulator
VAADAERAAELETPPGGPLLLLEGETVDQHGSPLEVFATWHRAEDIAFDVEVREEAMTLTAPRSTDPTGPGAPAVRNTGEAADLRRAAEQARQLAELLADLAAR